MFGRATRLRLAAIEADHAKLRARLYDLSTKLSTGTNAALRVELTDLQSALEMLAASNRREFGKIWKRLGGVQGGSPREPLLADVDEELAAILALQSAPTPEP